MNVIFGAGGVAREVAWMLHDIHYENALSQCVQVFVVADKDRISAQHLDGVPVIAETEFLKQYSSKPVNAYIAVGVPDVKRRVVAVLRSGCDASFPNLVHPKASMDSRPTKIILGRGNVIYPMASLTTNVHIGDFVQINPGATVGHDSRIGDFCTLCPGVHVSGRVALGEGCFVGAGAVIKEGLSVAPNCVVGAGTVIIRSIAETGTWVGMPARRLPD